MTKLSSNDAENTATMRAKSVHLDTLSYPVFSHRTNSNRATSAKRGPLRERVVSKLNVSFESIIRQVQLVKLLREASIVLIICSQSACYCLDGYDGLTL